MHWANTIVIAWVIEFLVLIVLIRGFILVLKSLKRLEENIKKPLLSILIIIGLYILLSIFIGFLVTQKIDYESYIWLIPPGIGLIASFILVKKGKNLFIEVRKN